MSDGALTVEELIGRAAEMGVNPSVTDHVSRSVSVALHEIAQVAGYLDVLERFDVLRGAEFCWHDSLWRELPDDIHSRFSHRIGSLHSVRLSDGRMLHTFARSHPDGLTAAEYISAFAACGEALAREMPVDIMAHPTLVAFPFRGIPPEELWTESAEERLVDALAANDIAFELSNRYLPHARIVRRAIDAGVRISLGSDGHTREQVADIRAPFALARALGVGDEELYDPRRHGSRTMAAHHA